MNEQIPIRSALTIVLLAFSTTSAGMSGDELAIDNAVFDDDTEAIAAAPLT